MKLGSLTSGGKDSIYSIYEAEKRNHSVETILGVKSDNLGSWMFHTQNIDLIELQAESMGKNLVSIETKGEKEKEVQDLEELIKKAVSRFKIDGIIVGAIESQYQRERVEKVCKKLGLDILAPLWHIKTENYIYELINNNFEVIITEVAAQGLGKEWLGRRVDEGSLKELKSIKEDYGIHIAGEGGEYETLVLDCPLFDRKIEIKETEKRWEGNRGSYNIKKAKLAKKS